MSEGAKTLLREGHSGLCLTLSLPSFLKKTLEPKQAKDIIRRRIERRSEDFLLFIKKWIDGRPRSPILKLLENTG